jgi:oleandomycin transport system ATP-binding protein
VGDVAQARTESPRAGVISVPVSGDEVLPRAVRRLSAAGIVVTELSLHLPSLDEAFLALTGTTTPREPTLVEVAA